MQIALPRFSFNMRGLMHVAVGLIVGWALLAESAYTLEGGPLSLNPGAEDRFVALINASRAANGQGGLAVDGTLVGNARTHSAEMAGQGTIFHNGSLPSQLPGGWRSVGENVGVGGDVDGLHSAFMNSPGHRANVLGDYDRVGIGVEMAGSAIYVTEVFWKTASAPAASAASGGGGTSAGVAAAPVVVTKRCRFVRGRRKCTVVKRRKRAVRRVRRRRRR
jgi:cysteine-rich secretory family protein